MDSRCFSKTYVIEFLELYRSLPCLWKIKSKDYSNRDKKMDAYQLLIDKLREVDPTASKETVVKKIDSFRGSFRKEVRKVEELKKSGEDMGYKPKLWYFDHLTFLRDQMPSTNNTLGTDELTNEIPIKIEEHQYSDEYSIDGIIDEPSSISIVSPTTTTPAPLLSLADTFISSPFKEGPSKKRSVDTCVEETTKKICVHLDKPDIFNDEFTIIGINIANKLRKLPSEAASVAEKLITDVLFEALCGNINQHTRINLVDVRKSTNFM